MYKIISSLLFIAFFAGTTAFASTGKPVAASTIESLDMAPETVLSLSVSAPFPGSFTVVANWTADTNGPFTVTLRNLTTGAVLVNDVTNLFTYTFAASWFVSGNTYRVSVGDTNILSQILVVK